MKQIQRTTKTFRSFTGFYWSSMKQIQQSNKSLRVFRRVLLTTNNSTNHSTSTSLKHLYQLFPLLQQRILKFQGKKKTQKKTPLCNLKNSVISSFFSDIGWHYTDACNILMQVYSLSFKRGPQIMTQLNLQGWVLDIQNSFPFETRSQMVVKSLSLPTTAYNSQCN